VRGWGAAVAIVLAMLAAPLAAAAQGYPARGVAIVVPYAPGGTNDILARLVAQSLTARFAQPVMVENRAGGNGIIGTDHVAKARPDGHVIGIVPTSVLTINPWLYPDMPFRPATDLAPITQAVLVANVLVVHPAVAAGTVGELIALARRDPQALSYASMGAGSTGHLSGELFKAMTGAGLTHVPYKGSAPALNDLLGGRVQAMFDNLPTALPFIRDGRLRALGVTSRARSPAAPDVPTIDEAGVPGFEAASWFGFVAPARTPAAIIGVLSAAIVAALHAPDLAPRLRAEGMTVIGSTPDEFAAVIRAETERWGRVVTAAAVKID